MDPKQIVADINEALAQGVTSSQINQMLQSYPPEVIEQVRLLQMNEIGGGAVGDFGRMALQGFTFGFGDEMIGMFAGDEAKERSRQRLSTRRAVDPVAAGAAEIFGGLLVPGIAAAKIAARAPSLLQMGARGALIGAAEGALVGAGEADEGSRLTGAGIGAGIGAAGGALLTPVIGAGGAAARTGGRRVQGLINRLRGVNPEVQGPGPQVAQSLVKHTGIEANANEALGLLDQTKADISANIFSQLDEQFPEVDAPAVTTYLSGLTDNKDTRSIVGAVSRELRDNIGEGRLPSFAEVQDVRRRLIARGLRDEADELSDIMEETFGEEFSVANAAWRRASRLRDAIEAGEKSMSMGANQLERTLGGMDAGQRAAFLQGRVSEMVQRLQRRETGVVAPLTDMLDAGPTTDRALRAMFPDDASFRTFKDALQGVAERRAAGNANAERDALILRHALNALGIATGVGGTGLIGRAIGSF